jgi:hypothetical protein
MRTTKRPGVAIATAAAMIFGSTLVGTAVAADSAKIQCTGVNGCKSQSACKTANNACKGQNSCKGQGFLELTAEQCKAEMAKVKKEASQG